MSFGAWLTAKFRTADYFSFDPLQLLWVVLAIVSLATGHMSAAILFTLLAATVGVKVTWRRF